jgi:lipopolysaccharide transport system permease protein
MIKISGESRENVNELSMDPLNLAPESSQIRDSAPLPKEVVDSQVEPTRVQSPGPSAGDDGQSLAEVDSSSMPPIKRSGSPIAVSESNGSVGDDITCGDLDDSFESFRSSSPTGEPAVPPFDLAHLPVTIIRPTKGWRALDLREVWRYRELLLTLAWREITIRYKQTLLGAAWAIIQPLMTTGIFSVLFALLMGRGNEPTPAGIPYVVSTFCAMLPWQLFAHSLNQSGNILIQYRSMITKVYFPRLILPAAAVLSTLVDFSIAFVALLVLMMLYGVVPSWAIVFLPAFTAMAVIAALAVGLWLAALNAIYRDFRYVIPFIVQLGMFISPVVYSTDAIRDKLSPLAMTLYSLNPMVGVIEGFRWALLGTATPPGPEFLISALATVVILIGGMFYFRRMECLIADLI